MTAGIDGKEQKEKIRKNICVAIMIQEGHVFGRIGIGFSFSDGAKVRESQTLKIHPCFKISKKILRIHKISIIEFIKNLLFL